MIQSLSEAVRLSNSIGYPISTSESQIMAQKSSDTLPTHIEYHSTDLYYTYTMYNPADIHWDVLNDIMSSYYLHYYRIFGLNGLAIDPKPNTAMMAVRPEVTSN